MVEVPDDGTSGIQWTNDGNAEEDYRRYHEFFDRHEGDSPEGQAAQREFGERQSSGAYGSPEQTSAIFRRLTDGDDPVGDALGGAARTVGGALPGVGDAMDQAEAAEQAATSRGNLQGLWQAEADLISRQGQIAGPRYEELGASDMEGIAPDSRAMQAQQAALEQMQQLSRGNLSRADMSRLQAEMRTASQQERGQREAIMQNAQERGMGGSGMAAAAALQAQQSGANRAADFAANIEGSIQSRALGALESGARQAGQMRQDSFNEARTRAAAQQARDQYNNANRNAYNQADAEYQRQFQAQRFGREQDLYNRQQAFQGGEYTGAQQREQQAQQGVRNAVNRVGRSILNPGASAAEGAQGAAGGGAPESVYGQAREDEDGRITW